jgi:cytidine deaminase
MTHDFHPECRFYPDPDLGVMRDWLMGLRQKSYAPGSHYKVANILAAKSQGGFICFGGVNVESLDHRQSVHSEESALAFMVTALGRNTSIHAGWTLGAPDSIIAPCADPIADISATPCGNCRQQMMGLAAHKQIPIHAMSLNGHDNLKTIGQLLPDDFQFENFLPHANAERAAAQDFLAPNNVEDFISRVIRHGPLNDDDIFNWLSVLDSIDYASHISQSVILLLDNGFYVAGVRVENAAYTGLNATQSALGIATTNFGKSGVRAIYTLSQNRQPGAQSDDLIYPLSLPSLQGLNEFVDGPDVPVTLFTAAGDAVTFPYKDAGHVYSSFAVPAYRILNGTLQPAS